MFPILLLLACAPEGVPPAAAPDQDAERGAAPGRSRGVVASAVDAGAGPEVQIAPDVQEGPEVQLGPEVQTGPEVARLADLEICIRPDAGWGVNVQCSQRYTGGDGAKLRCFEVVPDGGFAAEAPCLALGTASEVERVYVTSCAECPL